MNANNQQRLLVIIAGAIVGLFLVDKILLTPLTASWSSRSEAIAQLRKSIASAESMLDRETITNNRWDHMRRNTLPNDPSQAEETVLEAFDQWSQETRISVSSIKPQWKRGDTEDHSLLECRVDASGSIDALSDFLRIVEESPMALRIESVEIASRDRSGSKLTLGLLVSGLRLTPMEQN